MIMWDIFISLVNSLKTNLAASTTEPCESIQGPCRVAVFTATNATHSSAPKNLTSSNIDLGLAWERNMVTNRNKRMATCSSCLSQIGYCIAHKPCGLQLIDGIALSLQLPELDPARTACRRRETPTGVLQISIVSATSSSTSPKADLTTQLAANLL